MLDCQKYNPGEAMVKEYLESTGRAVIDVSKNRDYWLQDIDFLAVKGERTEKIEVKYDRNIHKYAAMFVELQANIEKGQPGWIDTTKADFIFYVDAISQDCHIVKPQDLRTYIATNKYQVKYCHKDGYKTTSGAIIPLEDFAKQFRVVSINLCRFGQDLKNQQNQRSKQYTL